MSDFNDNLVARSPKEWVASMYLSEKQKVIDDVYFFNKSNDNSGDKARGRRSLKASLESLFSVCEPRLIDLYESDKEHKYNPDYLLKLINSSADSDLLKVRSLLFHYLHSDLKLTDIAGVQNYNRTNPFLSNKIKGFK